MLRSKRYEIVSDAGETVIHQEDRQDRAINWVRKDPEARERRSRGESLSVLRVSTSVVHEVRRH